MTNVEFQLLTTPADADPLVRIIDTIKSEGSDTLSAMIVALIQNPARGFAALVKVDQRISACVYCAYVGLGGGFPSGLISFNSLDGTNGAAAEAARWAACHAQNILKAALTFYVLCEADALSANSTDGLFPYKDVAVVELRDRCAQPVCDSVVEIRSLVDPDDLFWSAVERAQWEPRDCFDHGIAQIKDWALATVPGRSMMFLGAYRKTTGDIVGTMLPFVQGRIGWCEGISVLPDARKNGVASRLIATAVEMLTLADAKSIRANIDARSNRTAYEMFARAGFVEVSRSHIYSLQCS